MMSERIGGRKKVEKASLTKGDLNTECQRIIGVGGKGKGKKSPLGGGDSKHQGPQVGKSLTAPTNWKTQWSKLSVPGKMQRELKPKGEGRSKQGKDL